MSEAVLRRFARDQWVRVHGTPRITVLVGGDLVRALWDGWLLAGALPGALGGAPDGAVIDGPLERAVPDAAARAVAQPAVPIAIHCTPAALAAWRAGRSDRLAAMVDEGVLEVADRVDAAAPRPLDPAINARSAAELALFEALEATPVTAGRFELNGYLSVRFGANAAEVDLLSRRDRIAVEIDGYYHFSDLDAYRRDRQKDLLLQSQGLFVIRVLAQDVMRDARPAIHAICQALAVRMRDHT